MIFLPMEQINCATFLKCIINIKSTDLYWNQICIFIQPSQD